MPPDHQHKADTLTVPAPPPSRTEASGDAQILLAVTTVLRRNGYWLVPAGVALGTAAALLVLFYTPKTYRAEAWVEIESKQPYIVAPPGQDSSRFIATQVELLRSPMVIESAISEVGVPKDVAPGVNPVAAVRDKLSIGSVGRSDLYKITLESTSPDKLADIVNGIVESFFRLRSDKYSQKSQEIIRLLDQEQERQEVQVRELRERVRALGVRVYGTDVLGGLPADTTPDSATQAIRDRLTEVEVERTVTESELSAFRELLAEKETEILDSAIEEMVMNTPEVVVAQEQVSGKAIEMQRLLSVVSNGTNDRGYQRLKEERDALELKLAEVQQAVRPDVIERLKKIADQQIKEKLRAVEIRLESLRSSENVLRSKLSSTQTELEVAGGTAMAFEFARAEYERKAEVYEEISQRALLLRTESRAPARVSLMKNAERPTSPVEEIPLKKMLLAGAGGFGLPLALAVFYETRTNRVSVSNELRRNFVPPVVEIPKLPSSGTRATMAVFQESIDHLRHTLNIDREHSRGRVLAVSSAIAREGKTTIATQLAISAAKATGGRVLLIDGDLRSPDIADALNITPKQGLVDVLENRCRWDDPIDRSVDDRIHVLSAGILADSPHRLVRSEKIAKLFDEARSQYSLIVVDTPPVLSANEALTLAQNADGTIICAMRDRSRARQVDQACDRLIRAGAEPICGVLSGVPTRRYIYSYGSYRYAADPETADS